MANVLNLPIEIPVAEEGPGYGGAMLAMVGCGAYASVAECADALVRTKGVVEPDPGVVARYAEQYAKFRRLYPALKDVFPQIR